MEQPYFPQSDKSRLWQLVVLAGFTIHVAGALTALPNAVNMIDVAAYYVAAGLPQAAWVQGLPVDYTPIFIDCL